MSRPRVQVPSPAPTPLTSNLETPRLNDRMAQVPGQVLTVVEHRRGVGSLVWVDPDHEHHILLQADHRGMPRRAVLMKGDCSPLSSHAAARTQPAVTSLEANQQRWQGIIETAGQACTRSSIRAIGRAGYTCRGQDHCPSGSRFVGGGLADGVELDDEAVGIRNFDMPAEVPFSGCSVLDPECVEVRAPVVEVVDVADAECDRAEAVERACESRSVVQAEGESALVDEDDTDNSVFFLEGEARFEAEHGGVPVAAAHDVGYRQPKVMQADNGRGAIAGSFMAGLENRRHDRGCYEARQAL